jgi:hypothetical protein
MSSIKEMEHAFVIMVFICRQLKMHQFAQPANIPVRIANKLAISVLCAFMAIF